MTWPEVRQHLKGSKIGLRFALTLERTVGTPPTSLLWDDKGAAFFWRDATGHETVIRTEYEACSFHEPEIRS